MAQRYNQLGTCIGGAAAKDASTGDLIQQDLGDADAAAQAFAYEHPSLMNPEALEPTSGRKAWMIRHGKRIKKVLKADKRGYIGS